jgi:hypothetical protein
MKSQITRRSFLKHSVVGAAAVANVSLFVGLVSAAESSGCLLSTTYTFFAFDTGFATQDDAIAAANAVNRDSSSPHWTKVDHNSDPNATGTCTPLSPPTVVPNPATFTTTLSQTLVGQWTYTLSSTFTITFCTMSQ